MKQQELLRSTSDADTKVMAIARLIKYVEKHQKDDRLVTGFNETTRKNPYKQERPYKCSIM